MSTLHTLHIGINQYHPQSAVTPLHGCHSDVQQWKDFLAAHFPSSRLATEQLLDAEATYENVVRLCGDAFLGRAQAGDTVLFTYSGHGSREAAAPAFSRYYPEGIQETLVLYDSRASGGLDLADKELAVLIARLARGGVEVVVVLDCCHAGSGTRSMGDFALGEARYQGQRSGAPRDLDSYLHGAYAAGSTHNNLQLPTGRHILLAAADRTEKAWETNQRQGLFTACLMSELNKTDGKISYAELFVRTRVAMRQLTDEQHPQFEPYQFFNSHASFLGLGAAATTAPLLVSFDNQQWQANMGAVHGLSARGAEMPAFELLQDGQPLGQIFAKSIGMEASTLHADALPLQPSTTYEARLLSLPAPKAEYALDAPQVLAEEILTKLKEDFRPRYFDMQSDAPPSLPYCMVASDGEIKLLRESDGKLLRTITGDDWPRMCQDAFETLEHIARWEKMVALDNPHTKIRRSEVELVFSELDADGQLLRQTTDTDITIDILRINGRDQHVPFRLEVRNNGQKMRHCALFYASDRYGFSPRNYNEPLLAGTTAVAEEFMSNGDRMAFKLERKSESADIFRLFVSNSPLTRESMKMEPFSSEKHYAKTRSSKPSLANQRDLSDEPSGDPDDLPREDNTDWFVITLRVRCVAQEAQINPDRTVVRGQGSISVLPHAKLRGNIALTTAKVGSRSTDPLAVVVGLAQAQGLELLPLQAYTRGASAPLNVLELTDLQHTEGVSEAEPLLIDIAAGLPAQTDTEELLLPLTFDGEHLLPVGTPQRLTDGTVRIRITQLPDTTDTRRRSLGKALRLCFLKLVLKKESVQYLRWVDYSGPKPQRRKEGLRERVAGAQRILLLLHGIIGDTKGMCDFAAPLNQSISGQPAPYDLVLTFDYENLNTPIQDTAGRLAELLRDEAGILPDSAPRITILAHSMGGLVSRYFIQNLGGDKLLQRLVLAGTPNQGSAIARLTTYRDYAIPLLTFLINLPWGIPAAATVLALLERSKDLTQTLAQMDWEQDNFLQNLQKGSLHGCPCSIVAGDLHRYLAEYADKRQLLDKVYALGGRLFYGDTPNDLAVSVESIQALPDTAEKTVVPCHHLSYFEEAASVQALLRALVRYE